MDKQDSWKRTEDTEIDMMELLREICMQWKQILICAVICAAVLGGYGYLKNRDSTDAVSGKDAAEETELTEEEQQGIADAAELEEEIQQLETYLENSVLMQIDAYHKDKVVMLYSIEQAKGREVQKITESYLNFIANGGAVNGLKESAGGWDMDSILLAELFSAGQKTYSVPYQILADSTQDWDMPAESLFYVEITGRNARMAERLADDVHAVLKEYRDRVNKKAGGHRLTLLSREKCQQADSGLAALQREKKALLSANKANLKAMTDAFSREQMMEYQDETNMEPGQEEPEEVLTNAVSRSILKYIMAGLICGIFLYAGCYTCLYLFRDTVKSTGEMRRMYTFPFYGGIAVKQSKASNTEKFEHEKAQIMNRIRLMCKKQGIKKLSIVSDFALEERERECMQSIAAWLKEWGIETLVAENGSKDTALWDALAETANVLIVCRIGTTTHRMIDEAVAFYLENDMSVTGAVAFV